MDHLMRLSRRQPYLVTDLTGAFRMQAVSLHQNVGNTGGLKQHTAIRDNNEYFLHVLKSNLFTE